MIGVIDMWAAIREMNEDTRKAYKFLNGYADYRNLDICDLFSKEVLVNNVSQAEWDWSIEDEISENGLDKEAAIEASYQWFLGMSNYELFYERISQHVQFALIEDLAEELRLKKE